MAEKKSQFAELEEQMLKTWERENTFQKSLELRAGSKEFSFYDGPPFANGQPHFGHSLVTSIKDSLGRYKTMRGYYVARRNGWDCHGLPVEFSIEKQLGISGKKQILDLGMDKFNAACRDSVFMYKSDWEKFFGRIGRWTDAENAYATIDRNYTESVWWAVKQISDKGLLYKGFKSMPYCPRCETPLSNFEVNEGYKDNVPDPSLFVKFKLADEDVSMLAWTTTPWSLPGNALLAVKPDEDYVYVKFTNDDGQQETVILAKKRLEVLDEQDYQVTKELKGNDLVGKSYEPLFKVAAQKSDNLFTIVAAGFVSVEDGTGVLHVAPAFGEDDLSLGEEYDVPVLQTVDSSGHITNDVKEAEISGKFFKSADKNIIEYLTKKGHVFAAETFNHTYPFCYRCDSPLLYYAISTWFVKVSEIRSKLLKTAEEIEWTPQHIKQGRFGKWLEGARDWAISRNRYWGAPMPIWVNEKDQSDYIVVESLKDLADLSGQKEPSDLHRPGIDKIVIKKDGKTYKRVEEVLDCWFESGSMPVAQQHYPFENADKFKDSFPADYIGEGLDQTRLWFYVLHVISTILFEKPAYKNVLVNGIILAADGQKLSKRLKNYPPVEDVFADEGADSLRLYLLSNYQAVSGDYMRFDRSAMKDLNRNVLGTLLNTQRFFKMYADIDKWQPPKTLSEPTSDHALDKWLLARLNQTIEASTKEADAYKLAYAIQPVFGLIDDLSNWYVRRSRRRFWKSEDDNDKEQAYTTLYYVLVRVSQLLAPWAPFVSDSLWRELTKGTSLPASVHLSDWPEAKDYKPEVIEQMSIVREIINEGLRQRAEATIKVRQPLTELSINGAPSFFESIDDTHLQILQEELNIKNVLISTDGKAQKVTLDTKITPELKQEGIMRDLVRLIQNARKQAGLEVSDRINLVVVSSDKDVEKAVTAHTETIKQETLAKSLNSTEVDGFSVTVKIEGSAVKISLEKA